MEGSELRGDVRASEEELKGFAREMHTRGERVVGELFKRGEDGARLAIVEYHSAAARQRSGAAGTR